MPERFEVDSHMLKRPPIVKPHVFGLWTHFVAIDHFGKEGSLLEEVSDIRHVTYLSLVG